MTPPVEDRILVDESELQRRLQAAYELGYDAGWNAATGMMDARRTSDELYDLLDASGEGRPYTDEYGPGRRIPARAVQVGDIFNRPDSFDPEPERVIDVRPGKGQTVRIFTTRFRDKPYREHADNLVRIF